MKQPAESRRIPVVLLGGTGYVSGEILRLLSFHPRFQVIGIGSSSHAGQDVLGSFAHLSGIGLENLRFEPFDALARRFEKGLHLGVFAATPHGTTAALVDALLLKAEGAGTHLHIVDLSADGRFADPATFATLYGLPHGAPHLCASFTCAVPEHYQGRPPAFAAQPGCFTTAAVLPLFPLFATDLCEESVFVSGITGSSGSGRASSAKTHHPERHGNLSAYSPLAHRHEPEMACLLAAARPGCSPRVDFVPHSGPFVRGIHATIRATLREPSSAPRVVAALNDFYASSPFVEASTEPPALHDVVGTNRCLIGVAVRGRTAVLTSVIDNLVKGASGGAIQWMNRLFDLDDDTGLHMPGLGYF